MISVIWPYFIMIKRNKGKTFNGQTKRIMRSSKNKQ